MMRAHVVHEAGGPNALVAQELPEPEPREGWVTIAVKAFGLNRAEAITRAGGSGDAVPFPRVIGIEAVGVVVDGGGTDLEPGTPVATAMGGLGRQHDGSYAEMTQAKRSFVFSITIPSRADGTPLSWAEVGAIPETYLTALGCLRTAGVLDPERPSEIVAANSAVPPRVVMRPGASALGLAVAQIVAGLGGETIGVTRSPAKADLLRERGMTDVIISGGDIADVIRERWPDGATAVVDTIASTASMHDDLAMLTDGGRITIAGSLADSYETGEVDGVGALMERVDIAFYASESIDTEVETPLLQAVLDGVAAGRFATGIDTVIGFDDLIAAHEGMEANRYAGKVVVDLTR
ncbi:MAG: zinc-binding dehydrogenase [Actinomycetota bacterium]